MVLLLVVGLAAVIAVILIAVILSVRLGRNDDHEEPEDRHRERGHGRVDTGDPRRRDTRTPRPRPQAQDRRYPDRDDRRPDRDQAARSRDYDQPQQRPGRRDAATAGSVADPRRPAGARTRQPGSGRDNGGRRAGNGRSRHEATPAPYDTGPSPHLAADDFPSEPLHAADFPSAEFTSRPQPAADFPSGEFPSAPQHAADAPTARYRAVVGRPGDFPSEPLPAADFASAEFPAEDFASTEFPAADFASAEFPAADFPSEEMPAPSPRGRPAPPQADPGRGRSDSRRRPAKGQDAPKGRSRQLRKRDDDDWPSMEWDKLTDEQYWAELSSDKPLATTARSPKPASEPTPAATRNGRPRPAAAKPKPPAPAAGGHTRAREVPGRPARTSLREPAPAREPAPMREPVTQEREAVSRREPVTHEHDAVTERFPARPRQQRPAARPRGNMPPAARPDATATPPGGEPSLAMLTSLATGPTRVPDDDPLTSPSFSRPTTDSRSYRPARTSTQASETANGTRPDGPPAEARHGNGAGAGYGDTGYPAADYDAAAYAGNGGVHGHAQVNGTNGHAQVNGAHDHAHVNGTYQLPDYADPGYAYLPAATATPPAGTPQPADWYSEPAPAHTSTTQGNPYGSYVEQPPAASYPSIPPAGYQDQQPGAAFPAYPGDQRGYQEPAYDAAAQLPYPTPVAAGAARPAGPPAHPSDAGQFPQPAAYPEAAYPEDGGYGNEYAGQTAYADTYGNAAYAPGYPAADYTADPYGQDGYDGYPADQG
jgi:hypothetical protein